MFTLVFSKLDVFAIQQKPNPKCLTQIIVVNTLITMYEVNYGPQTSLHNQTAFYLQILIDSLDISNLKFGLLVTNTFRREYSMVAEHLDTS